jgi:CRISPR/Cas system-associated protein Cas10 (large subunit of type III CRISPR-Cas system)
MMVFKEESEINKQAEEPKSGDNQCLICGVDIAAKDIIFEQRLINDKDFCGKCFADIMNDTDGDTLVLPRLMG